MSTDKRIKVSLFLLRIGIFIVMFVWTIDKFIRPDHASAVFKNFYYISVLSQNISYLIGIVELFTILGFLIGFKKRFTYGAVLIFHGISTISSYKQYFSPFESVNLLFFAAWPMLAACIVVYYLRDLDTLFTIDK
jgi:uncharacterized membrane protein YkgB